CYTGIAPGRTRRVERRHVGIGDQRAEQSPARRVGGYRIGFVVGVDDWSRSAGSQFLAGVGRESGIQSSKSDGRSNMVAGAQQSRVVSVQPPGKRGSFGKRGAEASSRVSGSSIRGNGRRQGSSVDRASQHWTDRV